MSAGSAVAGPGTAGGGGPAWDAATYDGARRRLVPGLDLLYGTAADLVAAVGGAGGTPRVLDLGAGTGLLSAAVRAAVPGARLTVLDADAAMLDVARRRLGAVDVVVGDLRAPLPAGPWDAVVSAVAIHHLDDEAKRDLLARVLAGLAPGGVFVNVEQVAGPDPWWQERYEAWHEAAARGAGSDDAEWAAALERMRLDRCAPLEDQLAWCRAVGFTRVDAPVRLHRFAVYAGWRPS